MPTDLGYSYRVPRMLFVVGLLAIPAPGEASRIRKGPWVLDVATDRATVLFELDEAAPASVTVEGGPEPRTFESGSRRLHRVVVRGIEPDTRVAYAVRSGGRRLVRGSFTSAPRPGSPARYVVFGDVRTGHEAHAAVIRSIVADAPILALNTGDLVAAGGDDSLWDTFFSIERPLLRKAYAVSTLGNHEGYTATGVTAFRRYFALEGGRRGAPEDSVFRWGDTLFLLVSSNSGRFTAAQRRYFEEALARFANDETVRHRVVVVHAGPFSSGYHGANTTMNSDGFVEFLRRARIRIVFSGHDHDYERGLARGIPYVVTGAGGAPLYARNRREPYQERFEASYHHVLVSSHGDRLRLVATRADRTRIEDCHLEGGRWDCRAGSPAPEAAEGGQGGFVEIGVAAAVFLLAVVLGVRGLRRRRAAA